MSLIADPRQDSRLYGHTGTVIGLGWSFVCAARYSNPSRFVRLSKEAVTRMYEGNSAG